MKATEQDLREFSKLAGRAMDQAWDVIETIVPESDAEANRLQSLLDFLSNLVNQAYVLNGVTSGGALKALEAKP